MTLQQTHKDDAINIAPDLHTVIYEDDKMRVLKVTVPSGATADMHWHPHNINYVLAGGALEFIKPDGSITNADLSEGQVTSATTDIFHAVKNIGTETVETIQVELKD
jgi:oxalate decarboxylase/phosphoglucose isomerase-like protein (cupin superfamily)